MAALAPRKSSPRGAHPTRPLRRWLGGARELALLAKDAGVRWVEDACFRYAASLAYAAFFSVFPLLLLCVIGLGYFLGDGEEVRHRVVTSLAVAKSPEVHK